MRTAAICPTCATYENAVCVIYNGPTLNNINVPPLVDLQTALGSINASVGSVISLINNLAANPFFLTTSGTSGAATLTGNVLNVPNYQPPLQDVLGYGNHTDVDIYVEDNISSPVNSTTITPTYINVGDGTTSGIVGKGYFTITSSTGSGQIQGNSLTGNRLYEIPDADGTLALTSDITLQNATAGTNKNLTNGINLQGTGAGDNNTGTQDINALGLDAAKNNTGALINALGRRAAKDNTGNNVNVFGIDSGNLNSGDYVNGIGPNSLVSNSGDHVNAIGLFAGANNTFSYVNMFGYGASASANNQLALSKDMGSQMARIGYGGITASRLYTLPDASGTIALTNTAWSLSGNSGTTPGTDFIGTSDSKDLVFKTNNTEVLRFNNVSSRADFTTAVFATTSAGAVAQFWAQSGTGANGYAIIGSNSTDKGYLRISNGTAECYVKGGNLTASRTLQLPNASGTLAIEDYLVYTAVISQTGTNAPTVDYVLKNTLGFTPTFNYSGAGSYTIQAPALNWSANKVIVFVNPGYQATAHTIGWERSSTTLLSLYTVNSTNNTFTNSLLNKASIEIRIYP